MRGLSQERVQHILGEGQDVSNLKVDVVNEIGRVGVESLADVISFNLFVVEVNREAPAMADQVEQEPRTHHRTLDKILRGLLALDEADADQPPELLEWRIEI